MSEKKSLPLSELLAKFDAAIKTAEEEAPGADESVDDEAAAAAAAQVAAPSAADVADAATQAAAAEEQAAQTGEAAAEAEEQAVDAGDALCDIAQAYIDGQNSALGKEAQLFGTLFGVSAMNTMRKMAEQQPDVGGELTAAAQLYENAYAQAMQKLAEVSDELEAVEQTEDDLVGDDAGLSDEEGEDLAQAVYQAVVDELAAADETGEPADGEEAAQAAYDAVLEHLGLADGAGDESSDEDILAMLAADEGDGEDDGEGDFIDYPSVTDNAYRAAQDALAEE